MTLNGQEMKKLAEIFTQYLLANDDDLQNLPAEVRFMVMDAREDGIQMAIAKHPDFGYAVLTGSELGPVIVWLKKLEWTVEERRAVIMD